MAHDDANDPTFGLLAEDDGALTQHLCAECGVLSPPTRTAYTLIGKAHGWRVTRYPAPPRPGVVGRSWRFEWHCPTCWPAVRSARGDALRGEDGDDGQGHGPDGHRPDGHGPGPDGHGPGPLPADAPADAPADGLTRAPRDDGPASRRK